ncbi:hypothetical protein NPIL_479641 [Nephila pilipes]|uniref:Uncharacterized protein n=1 Tax=Nephila pilipes TaxID=299642 RepID=A0A8X6P6Z2_NEPPI|nr:hypothetical protein NPIL_479641 [Nephila pilipes]
MTKRDEGKYPFSSNQLAFEMRLNIIDSNMISLARSAGALYKGSSTAKAAVRCCVLCSVVLCSGSGAVQRKQNGQFAACGKFCNKGAFAFACKRVAQRIVQLAVEKVCARQQYLLCQQSTKKGFFCLCGRIREWHLDTGETLEQGTVADIAQIKKTRTDIFRLRAQSSKQTFMLQTNSRINPLRIL